MKEDLSYLNVEMEIAKRGFIHKIIIKQSGIAGSLFIAIIIYQTILLLFKFISTKDFLLLLFLSLASWVVIITYTLYLTKLNQLFYKRKLKGSIKGVLRKVINYIFLILLFYIWAYFVYIILYKGIYSLVSLKDRFSLIPIFNQLIFTIFGFNGFKKFNHLFGIGEKIQKNEPGSNILKYIDKHKLSN